MPQVRVALEKAFLGKGIEEIKLYEPEKAIALGAAIYASKYDGDDVVAGGDAFLTDFASFSYGTKVKSNGKSIIDNLILKGDKLPITVERVYYTVCDNQYSVDFDIYESLNSNSVCEIEDVPSSPIIEANLVLGHNTPKAAELHAKLTLTVDGLLEIFADDLRGNNLHAETKLNFSK